MIQRTLICILVYCSAITFTGCRTANWNYDRIIDEKGTYICRLGSSPSLQVELPGDYFFHALNQKYYPGVHTGFIKHAGKKLANHRPTILYAGHTTVEPYYASFALKYGDIITDSAFFLRLKKDMKARLGGFFDSVEVVKTGIGKAYRVRYQLMNKLTRIRYHHTEYFVPVQDGLLRFLFWSANSNTDIMNAEANGILMHRLQFAQH